MIVTSYLINKLWTFESKINLVPLPSEAEFDADIRSRMAGVWTHHLPLRSLLLRPLDHGAAPK